jgi:hypothetical protein
VADLATAHHDDVLVSRDGASLLDGVLDGADEPESIAQPGLLRGRVGDHEDRRVHLAGRLGAVPHLLVPAAGPVDDVEQVPALDHRTGRLEGGVQYGAVRVGAVEDPVVQGLAAVTEPVVETDVGPGDVPVQRHRDVDDDLAHVSSPSRAVRPGGPSSR